MIAAGPETPKEILLSAVGYGSALRIQDGDVDDHDVRAIGGDASAIGRGDNLRGGAGGLAFFGEDHFTGVRGAGFKDSGGVFHFPD